MVEEKKAKVEKEVIEKKVEAVKVETPKEEAAPAPLPKGMTSEDGGLGVSQEGTSTSSKPQSTELGGKEAKRSTVAKEAEAVINIYTSFNNTIVHVTDMSGKTISKITGGMVTKHDRLKANPTIAMFIAKRIAEDVKDLGVRSFYVRVRAKTRNPAPGPGAHTIVKSLTREGFKILNILDTTRMPRGGPKKKGGRRGRRP
ncbi:30S ribosomal protein S11 [archaeon]|jgi:small subunit ribosomal protein S11|nr:30S ribosomal protein S11 [archaeon]